MLQNPRSTRRREISDGSSDFYDLGLVWINFFKNYLVVLVFKLIFVF